MRAKIIGLYAKKRKKWGNGGAMTIDEYVRSVLCSRLCIKVVKLQTCLKIKKCVWRTFSAVVLPIFLKVAARLHDISTLYQANRPAIAYLQLIAKRAKRGFIGHSRTIKNKSSTNRCMYWRPCIASVALADSASFAAFLHSGLYRKCA